MIIMLYSIFVESLNSNSPFTSIYTSFDRRAAQSNAEIYNNGEFEIDRYFESGIGLDCI